MNFYKHCRNDDSIGCLLKWEGEYGGNSNEWRSESSEEYRGWSWLSLKPGDPRLIQPPIAGDCRNCGRNACTQTKKKSSNTVSKNVATACQQGTINGTGTASIDQRPTTREAIDQGTSTRDTIDLKPTTREAIDQETSTRDTIDGAPTPRRTIDKGTSTTVTVNKHFNREATTKKATAHEVTSIRVSKGALARDRRLSIRLSIDNGAPTRKVSDKPRKNIKKGSIFTSENTRPSSVRITKAESTSLKSLPGQMRSLEPQKIIIHESAALGKNNSNTKMSTATILRNASSNR
eukprot:GHVL01044198.1.p2 GENE.GHVL01044198.1~~GHVL01044198.1.p2  ORF type:complete len:291 (+),score=39.17 GHVL01044198.1:939-1811(+)